MLESLQSEKSKPTKPSFSSDEKKYNKNKKSVAMVSAECNREKCTLCNQDNHKLYYCPEFHKLSPQVRIKEVKGLKLCLNCLRPGHTYKTCVHGSCRLCNKKHNTLLHINKDSSTTKAPSNSSNGTDESSTTSFAHCSVRSNDRGMLATAIVKIQNKQGEYRECRAFLDPGSQINFMIKELCTELQLTQRKTYLPIRGIQNTQTASFSETQATIQSRVNAYKFTLSFSVLPTITANLPSSQVNERYFKLPRNIELADPAFNVPAKVDILLGSAIVWELLCVGQIKLGKNLPIAQKTKLGWIIAGPLEFSTATETMAAVSMIASTSTIENQLERFWEIEEGAPQEHRSDNDKLCETEFVATHKRNKTGRFEVRLPLKGEVQNLGSSRETAVKRLRAMERKFSKDSEFKSKYVEFMREDLQLGHMTPVSESPPVSQDQPSAVVNYLPHHAVVREDSTTTKLRIVFDGSCPTSSAVSINDIQHTGPTIQNDLFTILIRFRQHRYVITADIQKMYRQVLIQDDQRDLQRIVWREDPTEPIHDFRLNTITYGLASAPFLAVRCLHQLGIENLEKYPQASAMILNDFYVDDLLTGDDDVQILQRVKREITEILGSAGFMLHKWNANEPSILRSSSECTVLPTGDSIKTLGVCWNIGEDHLQYKTEAIANQDRVTKRSILSTIAQVFDPLGLMGPTIVCAKIILQKLWQLRLGWDESLPLDLHTAWTQYRENIRRIESISIPRNVLCSKPGRIEIHGFSDASEIAYGACIYLRSTNEAGEIIVRLLCAKSKVAPLKRVTLPRLELCGALLLAKLGRTVQQSLSIKIDAVYHWSDSTITLAWIRRNSNELQTFVANRVAEIQRSAPEARWNHVKSKDNPADVLSRGTTPEALKTLSIWWNGPSWLALQSQHWPLAPPPVPDNLPELKKETVAAHLWTSDVDIIERYSSLTRLQRVVAYCHRFSTNARSKTIKLTGPLKVEELLKATIALVRIVQVQEFASEITDLRAGREVSNKSKLVALHPFLDSDEVIRVGGRIHHAEIAYLKRHPILLPAKHSFTELVIRDAHLRQLHIGQQGLLAHLRQRYWLLRGQQAIRRVLRKCIVCFKTKPTNCEQLMGNLPETRVTPARAFLNSGIDYAGPFNIKLSRNKSGKAYLCIFVCFTTKATHLELVSDLSTIAFLNALKRFCARRGKCARLCSDNGLNFVGANNELRALTDMTKKDNDKIDEFLAEQSIEWSFIPPYSPHMGGLWEAAVRSAKTHLKKVIGNTLLSFEELSTVFAQIEAILNSWPLCPISDDPHDHTVLTPGHFLVGEPLNSFPEPDLSDVASNRLTRFQLVSQIRQNFWKRWSQEYLTNLQNRYKWQKQNFDGIKIGALVLLKDPALPPLRWRMARIIETHKGDDNLIRVVSVRTSSGITKRAITNICVLPIED